MWVGGSVCGWVGVRAYVYAHPFVSSQLKAIYIYSRIEERGAYTVYTTVQIQNVLPDLPGVNNTTGSIHFILWLTPEQVTFACLEPCVGGDG